MHKSFCSGKTALNSNIRPNSGLLVLGTYSFLLSIFVLPHSIWIYGSDLIEVNLTWKKFFFKLIQFFNLLYFSVWVLWLQVNASYDVNSYNAFLFVHRLNIAKNHILNDRCSRVLSDRVNLKHALELADDVVLFLIGGLTPSQAKGLAKICKIIKTLLFLQLIIVDL